MSEGVNEAEEILKSWHKALDNASAHESDMMIAYGIFFFLIIVFIVVVLVQIF